MSKLYFAHVLAVRTTVELMAMNLGGVRLGTATLALSAVLMIVACSSGGESSEEPTATTRVARQPSPTPVATVAQFGTLEFSVVYDVSGEIGARPLDGTFTWTQAGGKARADIDVTFGEFIIPVSVFMGDGYPNHTEYFVCAPVDEECRQFEKNEFGINDPPPPSVFAFEWLERQINQQPSGYQYRERPELTAVAGEAALCYAVRALEVCITEDQVLLSSDVSPRLEATSFSRGVDSSVFEMPYPVVP
jgi:hypothetical protein